MTPVPHGRSLTTAEVGPIQEAVAHEGGYEGFGNDISGQPGVFDIDALGIGGCDLICSENGGLGSPEETGLECPKQPARMSTTES